MSVKIRLSRIGKKKAPFYRIIAVDSRKKRDGAFLEDLGTYDVLNSRLVRFDLERVNYWVSQGALPSDSVKKLIKLFKESGLSTGKVEIKPETETKAKKASKKTSRQAQDGQKAEESQKEKAPKAEVAPKEEAATEEKKEKA